MGVWGTPKLPARQPVPAHRSVPIGPGACRHGIQALLRQGQVAPPREPGAKGRPARDIHTSWRKAILRNCVRRHRAMRAPVRVRSPRCLLLMVRATGLHAACSTASGSGKSCPARRLPGVRHGRALV